MAKHGRTIHADLDTATTHEPAPVDHLADIHRVLHGEPRVRTQVVLTRLAELNPTAYEGWTSSDLKTVLAHEGTKIGKSHGHIVIRTQDTTQALTQRHNIDDRNGDNSVGN